MIKTRNEEVLQEKEMGKTEMNLNDAEKLKTQDEEEGEEGELEDKL